MGGFLALIAIGGFFVGLPIEFCILAAFGWAMTAVYSEQKGRKAYNRSRRRY